MRRKSLNGLRKRFLKSRARKIKEEDRLLREYVRKISGRYLKSIIILFGSRARGNHLPYSDYDIAVILEKVEDKLALVEELRKLKPRGLPLDLLVFQVDELSDPLISGMLKKCRILYDGLGISPRFNCSVHRIC